jgi:hypothetical protein
MLLAFIKGGCFTTDLKLPSYIWNLIIRRDQECNFSPTTNILSVITVRKLFALMALFLGAVGAENITLPSSNGFRMNTIPSTRLSRNKSWNFGMTNVMNINSTNCHGIIGASND